MRGKMALTRPVVSPRQGLKNTRLPEYAGLEPAVGRVGSTRCRRYCHGTDIEQRRRGPSHTAMSLARLARAAEAPEFPSGGTSTERVAVSFPDVAPATSRIKRTVAGRGAKSYRRTPADPASADASAAHHRRSAAAHRFWSASRRRIPRRQKLPPRTPFVPHPARHSGPGRPPAPRS